MTREELEHAIRAAADITKQDRLIVIGSQAILGQHPDAPAALLVSREVDIYAPDAPEKWDMINGALGEDSQFHKTFGFYVDGVSPTTARLPQGWESRLVAVCNPNTNGATGWCLEVHTSPWRSPSRGARRTCAISVTCGRKGSSASTRCRRDSTPPTSTPTPANGSRPWRTRTLRRTASRVSFRQAGPAARA